MEWNGMEFYIRVNFDDHWSCWKEAIWLIILAFAFSKFSFIFAKSSSCFVMRFWLCSLLGNWLFMSGMRKECFEGAPWTGFEEKILGALFS